MGLEDRKGAKKWDWSCSQDEVGFGIGSRSQRTFPWWSSG